jgi:hypothetical protein
MPYRIVRYSLVRECLPDCLTSGVCPVTGRVRAGRVLLVGVEELVPVLVGPRAPRHEPGPDPEEYWRRVLIRIARYSLVRGLTGNPRGRHQITVAVVNVTTIGLVTWSSNCCRTKFSMSLSNPCLAGGVIICVLE